MSSFEQFMNKARSYHWAFYLLALMPWAIFWARALADIIVCVLALWGIWRYRDLWRLRREIPGFFWLLGAAIWSIAVVPILAFEPEEAFIRAIIAQRFPLFYVVVVALILSERDVWITHVKLLVFPILIAMVDTLVQWWRGVSLSGHPMVAGQRLTGPLGRPNIGMIIAKMLFPWSGVLVRMTPNQPLPAFKWLIALAAFITIILSGERMASLLVVFSLAVGVSAGVYHDRRYFYKALILMLAFMISIGLLVRFESFVYTRFLFLVSQLTDFSKTDYFLLWKASYLMIQESFLTGSGIDAFRDLCIEYHNLGKVSYCSLHPHNHYLEWFVSNGLIGLILYIGFVGSLLLFIFNIKTDWRLHVVALMTWILCYFPLSATQSAFSNLPAISQWYAIALSIALLFSHQRASMADK